MNSAAWTPEQSKAWLAGVTFGKPATYSGSKRIAVHMEGAKIALRISEVRGHTGEWSIEQADQITHESHRGTERCYKCKDDTTPCKWYETRWGPVLVGVPLRVAKAVAARVLKGIPRPPATVTRYEGGAPLRRVKPEAPSYASGVAVTLTADTVMAGCRAWFEAKMASGPWQVVNGHASGVVLCNRFGGPRDAAVEWETEELAAAAA